MTLPNPSHISIRLFSTSTTTHARSTAGALAYAHRNLPPYPYGPSYTYKQSNFGLYGGSHIQFGNNVSERNELKTRRYWRPNIHTKRLWSDAMARFVRVRVQARVLRTIDKVGGLDEYLLGGKAARLRELGMGGWKLRAMIMRTEKVKERFQRERELLGLVDGVEGAGVIGSGVGMKSEGEDEEEDDFEDEEEDLDEREDEERVKEDDRKVKSSEKRGLRGQKLQGQLVT